jgi:hypothetical protein
LDFWKSQQFFEKLFKIMEKPTVFWKALQNYGKANSFLKSSSKLWKSQQFFEKLFKIMEKPTDFWKALQNSDKPRTAQYAN